MRHSLQARSSILVTMTDKNEMEDLKSDDFSNVLSSMGVQSYDPLVAVALEEYSRSNKSFVYHCHKV
jgi:hypothetical protein